MWKETNIYSVFLNLYQLHYAIHLIFSNFVSFELKKDINLVHYL